MRNRFFTKNRSELLFEWNAASESDWKIIQRNFVAAYICAYKDRSLKELAFHEILLHQAEAIWEAAYHQACELGLEVLVKKIINPLKFYFAHEKTPFQTEIAELEKHFLDKSYNINPIRDYIIKLIMLQRYFEHDFYEEKRKLDAREKKIDYIVARLYDNPIAFFVCELNSKSARIYLRWVTIEPGFHRQGLGKIILDQIAKRYPDAIGMELYTRKANYPAQKFYKHYGFQEVSNFKFGKPLLTLGGITTLYLPDDEATNSLNAFVAFHKSDHSYRF